MCRVRYELQPRAGKASPAKEIMRGAAAAVLWGCPAKRSLSTITATAEGMIASDRCQWVRLERSYGQGGTAHHRKGLAFGVIAKAVLFETRQESESWDLPGASYLPGRHWGF
jgi:hypothetical protein